MKGVIFDLDGVLVDSMPSHSLAWVRAFQSVAGIAVDRRTLYVLEGMRGIELVETVFAQHRVRDGSLAQKVMEEKGRIFKTMPRPKPFEGVREMTEELGCKKAVASGSTRHDVCSILDEIVGTDKFDAIITSDDVRKGKPDPLAFFTACKKMRIAPADAVVVENAPLGVRAANNAGIPCYVALNSTVLSRQDFDGMIPADRIFEKTSSLKGLLKSMCT